jgi:hypothetical protein
MGVWAEASCAKVSKQQRAATLKTRVTIKFEVPDDLIFNLSEARCAVARADTITDVSTT